MIVLVAKVASRQHKDFNDNNKRLPERTVFCYIDLLIIICYCDNQQRVNAETHKK
jgi:hypothetical protein